MVCDYLPFGEEDKYETISHTLTKKFEFSDDIELSPELKDLINHLLEINPDTKYN